jgi:hypothetical protein
MVYKPGLEPEPGLGLWQALNLGLAQDFQAQAHQSQAQARALSPSQAQYITSEQAMIQTDVTLLLLSSLLSMDYAELRLVQWPISAWDMSSSLLSMMRLTIRLNPKA